MKEKEPLNKKKNKKTVQKSQPSKVKKVLNNPTSKEKNPLKVEKLWPRKKRRPTVMNQ
jgi:hypothetical protein